MKFLEMLISNQGLILAVAGLVSGLAVIVARTYAQINAIMAGKIEEHDIEGQRVFTQAVKDTFKNDENKTRMNDAFDAGNVKRVKEAVAELEKKTKNPVTLWAIKRMVNKAEKSNGGSKKLSDAQDDYSHR